MKGTISGSKLPALIDLNQLQDDLDALTGGVVGIVLQWNLDGSPAALYYELAQGRESKVGSAAIEAAIVSHKCARGKDERTKRASHVEQTPLQEAFAELKARLDALEGA